MKHAWVARFQGDWIVGKSLVYDIGIRIMTKNKCYPVKKRVSAKGQFN